MKEESVISYENAKNSEPIARKFLFKKSNFVQIMEIKPITVGPLTIIRKKKRIPTEKMELTDEIRAKIDKEGLFFDYPNSRLFKNMEDPVFYNNDEMIGKVITHEPIVYLLLASAEKTELEKQGVIFDPVVISAS